MRSGLVKKIKTVLCCWQGALRKWKNIEMMYARSVQRQDVFKFCISRKVHVNTFWSEMTLMSNRIMSFDFKTMYNRFLVKLNLVGIGFAPRYNGGGHEDVEWTKGSGRKQNRRFASKGEFQSGGKVFLHVHHMICLLHHRNRMI